MLPIDDGPPPEPGDLSAQRAHWLTRELIAWDVDAGADADYALHASPDGGLHLVSGGVAGGSSVPLAWTADALPDGLAESYPHLADHAVLEVADDADVSQLLTGEVAVAAVAPDGRRIGATGIQIAGVLDDLYADDAREVELGVTWNGQVPSLRLWAPTARSATLRRWDGPQPSWRCGAERAADLSGGTTTPMTLDPATGVWSVTGERDWKLDYYVYEVEVFVPAQGAVVTNAVTDPYSVSLATDSVASQIVDLDDWRLEPWSWRLVDKPDFGTFEDIAVYELHVRDFSIGDDSVPAAWRGTYQAFRTPFTHGMRHLSDLARGGMTHVHLLPTFDIATIPECAAEQVEPTVPTDAGSASDAQQAAVLEVADQDGFNWGYDPYHYNVPEGSYATEPMGADRIRQFRGMVAGLNRAGLRVVTDVVYNHTSAAGQAERSVLDRIVPGYYHRRLEDGTIATSTCCPNTATEHAMMEKLLLDSVRLWATKYRVDGFRFDLMGHHALSTLVKVRELLDSLTVAEHGIDGSQIYVYGEGWNYGEVADDARFTQATQLNLGGTGIGTFNDRLRDAVRGGAPLDENPRVQGWASGLYTDPNEDPVNGTPEEQLERLLLYQDQIRVGLAGNLADYRFVNRDGEVVTGAEVPYGGAPTGYTRDPQENVLYVSAHDNETLYDALAFKLPQATSMDDRIRMQVVALAPVILGQGVSFLHAGSELLRSKSLDRNSYNSGDWFNEVHWVGGDNNFGSGLPPRPDNEAKYEFMRPLLEDPSLVADAKAMQTTSERVEDLLQVKRTSPLLNLTTGAAVAERVAFHNTGEGQVPGLLVMSVDDEVGGEDGGGAGGGDLDPALRRMVVVFNAGVEAVSFKVDGAAGEAWEPHPVLAAGSDPTARSAWFDPGRGAFEVPARTVAVFVLPF